jgi:hypothetical protein
VTVPARVSESAIALTVAVAALNNLKPVLTRRVWIAAFAFGLVHGFGFANVLKDLGLAHASLLIALLGFNVGVELGQLAIVAVVMPLLWRARGARAYQRVALPAASLAVLIVASGWFAERALGVSLG